jgi:hypothetical protein
LITRAGLAGTSFAQWASPVIGALCWSHARRKFFELSDIAASGRRDKKASLISPIALEDLTSANLADLLSNFPRVGEAPLRKGAVSFCEDDCS